MSKGLENDSKLTLKNIFQKVRKFGISVVYVVFALLEQLLNSLSVLHVRDCKCNGTATPTYTVTHYLSKNSSRALSHASYILYVLLPYLQPAKRSDTVD